MNLRLAEEVDYRRDNIERLGLLIDEMELQERASRERLTGALATRQGAANANARTSTLVEYSPDEIPP